MGSRACGVINRFINRGYPVPNCKVSLSVPPSSPLPLLRASFPVVFSCSLAPLPRAPHSGLGSSSHFRSGVSLLLTIPPKTAAPTAFLACALGIIPQELGSHLLRLLQVDEKTREATDPAVSVKNSGRAEGVWSPPHAQEQYHVCCHHHHVHFPGRRRRQSVWLPGRSWSWPSGFGTVSGQFLRAVAKEQLPWSSSRGSLPRKTRPFFDCTLIFLLFLSSWAPGEHCWR